MSTTPSHGQLPAITLTHTVQERLSELAVAAGNRLPELAEFLERELDRACVVPDDDLPPATVTIGSRVTFVDCDTKQRHTVTLVWPMEEDVMHYRLSIMTPVGAALVGLRAGQSIGWKNRMGAWRQLKVESVH